MHTYPGVEASRPIEFSPSTPSNGPRLARLLPPARCSQHPSRTLGTREPSSYYASIEGYKLTEPYVSVRGVQDKTETYNSAEG